MKSRLLTVAGAIAAGATGLTYASYRRDITTARKRIEANSQILDSAQGPIEFAEAGDGPAVLFIHGAGGGFDQGLDVARAFLGDHYRVVAPSRFGYLGTPMPEDASPVAQADAHLRLLDALKLEKVPVIGISAGAPSALQLCLRNPERCSALVLLVPGTYAPGHDVGTRPSPFIGKMLNTITASDFLFWSAMKFARSTFLETILGTPFEVYENATGEERRNVDEMRFTILPVSRRAAGLRNDATIVSNLKRYPLEKIHVPTLVISAADDLYGTYENGLYTAEEIHGARFIGFSSGGHLLIGHDEEVRGQITRFLRDIGRRTAMAS